MLVPLSSQQPRRLEINVVPPSQPNEGSKVRLRSSGPPVAKASVAEKNSEASMQSQVHTLAGSEIKYLSYLLFCLFHFSVLLLLYIFCPWLLLLLSLFLSFLVSIFDIFLSSSFLLLIYLFIFAFSFKLFLDFF